MSTIPLYLQVQESLLSRIASGALSPGQPIPAEAELCAEYGVSRITVRKAVENLCADGVVQKVHGVGTFVREAAPSGQSLRFRGYLDDILIRDPDIEFRLMQTEARELPARIARVFGIEPGRRVPMSAILLVRRGKPVMLGARFISDRILDPEAAGALEPGEQPTVSIFRNAGILIGRGEQRMHATLASPLAAACLQVPAGTPVLASWRIYFDRQDRPVTAIEAIYHPDNLEMTVDLVPRAGGRFM